MDANPWLFLSVITFQMTVGWVLMERLDISCNIVTVNWGHLYSCMENHRKRRILPDEKLILRSSRWASQGLLQKMQDICPCKKVVDAWKQVKSKKPKTGLDKWTQGKTAEDFLCGGWFARILHDQYLSFYRFPKVHQELLSRASTEVEELLNPHQTQKSKHRPGHQICRMKDCHNSAIFRARMLCAQYIVHFVYLMLCRSIINHQKFISQRN